MAFEPHPWFIGLEGVEHSAEVARTLAWAATSGASGIIKPTDLRVRATPVPGGTVRIMPGGFVVESSYAGASQQSYVERVPTTTEVAVPATGSSGSATRYVVAAILDPDYPGGGTAPEIPNDGVYAAPRVTTTLNLAYPHVPLARINQPANTATITDDMITDLREVANPRTLDVWRPRATVKADEEYLTSTSTDGEWFPNGGGEQLIYIPEWATRAQICVKWLQVRIASGKSGWGQMWLEYGPYLRPSTRERSTQRYQWDTTGGKTYTYRENWIVEDDVYIPAAYRGTEQTFVLKARRDPASDNRTALIDGLSGVSLQVRFLESADPSTS